MPYDDPHIPGDSPDDPPASGAPPRRPFRRGGGLVAVAALVPAGLVGWLLWSGASGAEGEGPGAVSQAQDQSPSSPEERDDKPAPSSPKPSRPSADTPLKGRTIVIDPGHNPGNKEHAAEIGRFVDVGTHRKECDTTGTSTQSGYTEAEFTLDVAHRLRTLLEKQGATVKFTQDDDRPFGPCVDERARIGNEADADAVVSVHADGSGAGRRGFHVIRPARVDAGGADTSAIVGPSRDLAERIAGSFVRATGSAPANYIGDDTGLDVRDDLGGLNLSKVPKVFIECGNMRDAKDAELLTSGEWRQKAARGIAEGVEGFLGDRSSPAS